MLQKTIFYEKSNLLMNLFLDPSEGFFNPKQPHDMVSFFFAGFTLFRNVHFLQDKEQAWMSISWLPRPWELARILPNFIFYVNQASKPHFNEFPFFQKISRNSSRVNYAVSGLRGRLLIKNIILILFFLFLLSFSDLFYL